MYVEVHELRGLPGVLVIDVRSAEKFAAGHVEGAINGLARTRRARSMTMAKTLFILNDAPCGSDRSYNALRLAGALAKREGEEVRSFSSATRRPARRRISGCRRATTTC